MQHSDKRKYINRIVLVVVFVCIFIGLNCVLNLMLEFPESESEKMLTGYTQHEDIDTVIVGNSITNMIDCDTVDEKLNVKSYNMGTPSQTFSISHKIIQMSSEQNPVKRVIIFTGFDSFEKDDVPVFERVFNKTRISSKPFWERTMRQVGLKYQEATAGDNANTTDSVTVWFDWIDNHVDDGESIKKNINNRVFDFFKGDRLGKDFEYDLDRKIYARKDVILDNKDEEMFAQDMQSLEEMDISKGILDIDSLKKLDEICKYCRENSIELIYFISPHQTDYKKRYNDNYEKMDAFLSDFIGRRGGIYYNFENDSQIHTLLPDDYFYDWEHVKSQYRDKSTEVFCEKLTDL